MRSKPYANVLEIHIRDLKRQLAEAQRKVSAEDLLEWMKTRPGASWVATIRDVAEVLAHLEGGRADSGDYRQARGASPRGEGEPSAEEVIRKGRGG